MTVCGFTAMGVSNDGGWLRLIRPGTAPVSILASRGSL